MLVVVVAVSIILGIWLSNSRPCEHAFERADDRTERYASYICTKCGKVKRIKLR